MVLGIDASTQGSGGAKRHLIELLENFNPEKHGFVRIKIWGVQKTLAQLPNAVYIEKASHPYLNKGFFHRTIWQLFYRDVAFRNQFDVLFSPFGTYTGKITPYVSMSRNMLVFDRRERKRFGLSWLRLKMKILYYKQKRSFQNAQGLIFLSQSAKDQIGKAIHLGNIRSKIIPHGVSDDFRFAPKRQQPILHYTWNNPFTFLYVSTIWMYKHPWNVVAAIKRLRRKNYPVTLTIVGDTEFRKAGRKLSQAIAQHDPLGQFITWQKHVSLNDVSSYYRAADAFVFASTCENMPNILIEAMASGLPIACSSYKPMPEFLGDGGLYFDPTNIGELEVVLEKMILDHTLRGILSSKSFAYSGAYSWKRCADQTYSFLHQVGKDLKNK